jgi:hypothetical protein
MTALCPAAQPSKRHDYLIGNDQGTLFIKGRLAGKPVGFRLGYPLLIARMYVGLEKRGSSSGPGKCDAQFRAKRLSLLSA